MSPEHEHNDIQHHEDSDPKGSATMKQFFGQDEVTELLHEDNTALKNVSLLLAAIIALGVGIALVAIALTVPQ